MSYDVEAWLESSARALIRERHRVPLVVAAASYLRLRVRRDGHFAQIEQDQVRLALAADFDEAELAWIVEALRDHPHRLAGVRTGYWVRLLHRLVFGVEPQLRDDPHPVTLQLEARWPMLEDSPRALHTTHLRATQEGIEVGRPESMSSLLVRWQDLVNLEAVEPWPQLLIEWREGGALRRSRVGPRSEPEAFDGAVEALFDAAERRPVPDSKLRAGWLTVPRARWEPVDELPSGQLTPPRADYRSAPMAPDPVVASRPARGGLGMLLAWLASSPSRPFRATIREAVLTERYLYVRRHDGRASRLPVELLRGADGGLDAVYRFGRGTLVLLTDRGRCAVCQALDARLAG